MRKILYMTLISLLLIFSLTNCVFADARDVRARKDDYNAIANPSHFKPFTTSYANGAGRLESIGNQVVGVLQVLGSIISVAMLGFLGIKYMLGSADEKAEYKKTLRPYVIGAFMIFGITNILVIVVKIAEVIFIR